MPESSLTIFLSPKKVNYDLVPQSAVPVRWVYLGKQFHEKIRIEQELGPSFHGIDIARTHNDVADRIRKEFVDWIDELNLLNGTSMEWWCGAVSSRNVYRSDVFQFCCYIEILEMIWKDTATRPSFVIVESPALAESIRAWGIARVLLFQSGEDGIQQPSVSGTTACFFSAGRILFLLRCSVSLQPDSSSGKKESPYRIRWDPFSSIRISIRRAYLIQVYFLTGTSHSSTNSLRNGGKPSLFYRHTTVSGTIISRSSPESKQVQLVLLFRNNS